MDTLRVATINVWGLPWPLARQRGRRLARLQRWLADEVFDVVGLQELWWPHPPLALDGLRLPTTRRDAGLAVCGRRVGESPLAVRHFRAASSVDALKAKGVLEVLVGAARVAVTHLQAGHRHAAVRRAQVDELLAGLGVGPTVLLGDFNFHGAADDPADRALHDAGFVDVGAARGEPTWLRRNPFARAAVPRRFDRIYVRADAGWRWHVDEVAVEARVVSDHQPVRATLRLERR